MNPQLCKNMTLKSTSLAWILALLATIGMPTEAAQQYATFEKAQARVSDTGYIVFIHPEGWDKYGEKFCKKLIAHEAVRTAAADAALILAPLYQNRNEANKAKAKQIMGSLGYPGDMSDISYPALVFYEKGGRQYATLHGRELMRSTPEQVAAKIQERLAAKKQQDALLQQSRSATDAAEKARLLLESSRISGLEWPGGLRDAMNAADPNDTHGYRAALNFGFSLKQDESLEDLLKRLDEVLQNDRYTPWQKQRACAVTIGHLRRSLGAMAGGRLITKYARAMHKLDPDSALGLSAPVVMRDWVQQYHYGQGWSPEIIPSTSSPLLMRDVPMNKPGTYAVSFKLKTGRDGIRINKLRLMDGDRCIVADNTPRDVSWGNTQQTYTFTVKQSLKNPALEITYGNAADKRSTWGDISVTPQ